jgi:hypothetical protein
MTRWAGFLAALVLVLGLAGAVAAADDELATSGRLLLAAGGDIAVAADEQADAVFVIRGDAHISGTVNALVVIDGTATISGATLDSLVAINSTVELEDGTTILGDLSRLGASVHQNGHVEIGGTMRDLVGDAAAFGLFLGAAAIVLWIGVALATLVVGLLVAALGARQVHAATRLITRQPGTTFLVGLLAVIVPPLVAALLFVTILGIPAAIGLLLFVWPAAAFVGYLVAVIWIGEWLLGARGSVEVDPEQRPFRAVLLGLVAGFVLGIVPLLTAVISIFGLGAVVRAAWQTLRRDRLPQPSLQPAPVAG